MIRVALLAEQALVREGLRILLDNEPDIQVVAAGADAESAGHDALPADVVVLVTGPDLDADAIRQVHERIPRAHLLVLSPHASSEQISLAFATGVRGYLLEESAPPEFLEAVRAVSRGEAHLQERLGTSLARQLATGTVRSLPEPRRGLSPREREVLALLARGHTNAEIAATLGLSPRTVEAHRLHIVQKLAVRSRAEIVRYAQAEGLL